MKKKGREQWKAFLVEKKNSTLKTRAFVYGSTQREYTSEDDVTSPTLSIESALITGII